MELYSKDKYFIRKGKVKGINIEKKHGNRAEKKKRTMPLLFTRSVWRDSNPQPRD